MRARINIKKCKAHNIKWTPKGIRESSAWDKFKNKTYPVRPCARDPFKHVELFYGRDWTPVKKEYAIILKK